MAFSPGYISWFADNKKACDKETGYLKQEVIGQYPTETLSPEESYNPIYKFNPPHPQNKFNKKFKPMKPWSRTLKTDPKTQNC